MTRATPISISIQPLASSGVRLPAARLDLLADFAGAQLIVRVRAEAIFPNCPRYIHKMQQVETSDYAPCEGHTPPIPEWKTRPVFNEVLPPGDPARG